MRSRGQLFRHRADNDLSGFVIAAEIDSDQIRGSVAVFDMHVQCVFLPFVCHGIITLIQPDGFSAAKRNLPISLVGVQLQLFLCQFAVSRSGISVKIEQTVAEKRNIETITNDIFFIISLLFSYETV